MKKAVSFILTLLLVLSILIGTVACNNDAPGVDPNSGVPDNEGTSNDDSDKDDDRIELEYLPDIQFITDGQPRQFNILEWNVGATSIWRECDVVASDGSKLSEAVFARNAAVEEKFGVEITSVEGAPETLLPFAIGAGDDLYQLVTQRSISLYPQLVNDQFIDMNEYSQYIHTDMPWWVQTSIEAYTLGEHLYMASSEMLLRDKGATNCITFNKEMASQYESLPDFYQLVNDKGWTIWEMAVAAEAVCQSDDGDDLMNSDKDLWGFYGWQEQASYFYIGAGYQYARVNEDGVLEAEVGELEETVSVYADIFENVMFTEWYYDSANEKELVNPQGDMFQNDRALFASYALITLPNGMKTDYGVLPIPGYSEEQLEENGYHSLVYMHGDCVVAIPTTVVDPEFSAIILEAISWESYYTVSPTFYDELLLTRWLRDKESVAMMKIILDTRTYDPGQFWGANSGLFSLKQGLCATCMQTKNPSIVSMWGNYGDLFKQEMEQMNDLAVS